MRVMFLYFISILLFCQQSIPPEGTYFETKQKLNTVIS
jgi:hypothetical protein